MKKIVVLLILPLLLAHCASVSTLQTGRVLKKGDSFHTLGVGTYGSDDFLGGNDISLPLIEYTYRRGFWKDIDAGIKLAIIGSTMVDVKYNLVDGDKFALATGLGIGYLSFTSEFNGVEQKSTIIDFMLPLYLSYDVGQKVTLYGAPKFMFRTISASSGGTVSGDGSLLSSTLGVKWGVESGVFLEGSLIAGLDSDFTGTQFNGAYFFRF